MNNSLTDHIKVWEDFFNSLPPKSKIDVGNIHSINEFIEWASANGIIDPINLWQAREDSLIEPVESPIKDNDEVEDPEGHGVQSHRKHTEHYHTPEHEFFEKEVKKSAEKDAARWEKKPNFELAKSKEEAFKLSHDRSYDSFVKHYPALAEDWVKKHNDQNVISALARKALQEEQIARQKAAQKITVTRIAWAPSFRKTTTEGPFIAAGRPRNRGFGRVNNLAGRSLNRRRAAGRAVRAARAGKAAEGGLAIATGGTSAIVTTVVFNRKILLGLAIFFGICAFLFIAVVFAAGCAIVGNPIGDVLGVDYCKGGGVVAAQPTPTQPPGGISNPPIDVPDCSANDSSPIDSGLLSDFGITITGSGADCDAKQEAFTTFATLFQSTTYANLVKRPEGTTITMTSGGCAGRTSGDDFRIGDCSNHSLPYFYVHEMGHVIRNNHDSLRVYFENSLSALIKADKNCYSGQFLKTYLLRSGVDPKSESFAEAIALYYLGGKKGLLDPSRGFFGQPINNFQSECPATYAWVKSNIFGGYDFTESPTDLCTPGSTSNCGGAYNLSQIPGGQNFGDRSCQLVTNGVENKQLVADEIKRQLSLRGKTVDYCRWTCIAHNESGFDPNSFNGNAARPKVGAWGLFQMEPNACFTSDYKSHRTGNVDWKDQIRIALSLEYDRLEPHGIPWNYWSTSRNCVDGKFKTQEPNWSPGVNCLSNGGVN